MKFIFDGTDMYVVSARGIWNDNNKPGISYISYTRLKEWKYTDKGWFCYELCVPEPPEVSEIMDGSSLIRIKPMTEEQREMSERLVLGLGYQGQNILCSNWNAENMSELDYNGMFEYLYGMKYGKKFNSEDYPNGIPKEEFESLIMEYLPITAEQIREYAVFDEENHTYYWDGLGCLNYAPTFFGTSLPEVLGIKENDDETVTLTVEAVCDMVICDDAVITHELTVRFAEDGSFQYLGNEILNDGITRYRITNTVFVKSKLRKNDLIIVVFYGNLTDVRKERRRDEEIEIVRILAAAILIGGVISIPLINNHTAYKVEKALCEIPLPEETELIESLSQAGKLTGNGNGMQYFGAILIRSELSLEELDIYYSRLQK